MYNEESMNLLTPEAAELAERAYQQNLKRERAAIDAKFGTERRGGSAPVVTAPTKSAEQIEAEARWLKAARGRCAEVEVELRAPSGYSGEYATTDLQSIGTRPI
jgi:hypothetical protein